MDTEELKDMQIYIPDDNSSKLEAVLFGLRFVDGLDSLDRDIFNLIIGTHKRNTYQGLDMELLMAFTRRSERRVRERIRRLINFKLIIKKKEGNRHFYRFDLNPIRKLACTSNLWGVYKDSFSNTYTPPPITFSTETEEEVEAAEKMGKDAQAVRIKRTKNLNEIKKSNEVDRERCITAFYKELNENCLRKFLSLYFFLQFKEYGEALYKFVLKIRDLKNPHLVDIKQFEDTLSAFIKIVEDGSLFKGKGRNVFYKRGVLMKYFKNIQRPKFASCIKGVSNELADKLASMDGFKERAIAIFKAVKNIKYPYKDKLWYVIDTNGSPYLPAPYREDHLYASYPIYNEAKYKDKK